MAFGLRGCILKAVQRVDPANYGLRLPGPEYLAWVHKPPTFEDNQSNFIEALERICILRRNELPLNPLVALHNYYRSWLPDAVGPAAIRTKALAAIEDWASSSGLVDDAKVALSWVIEWAEDYLIRFGITLNDVLLPLDHPQSLSMRSTEVAAPLPPQPGYAGSLPVPIPQRGRLRVWNQNLDMAFTELKRRAKASATPAEKRRKSGTYQKLHYDFLVLRFCGMTWPAINNVYRHREYQDGEAAVKMGAKIVAKHLGFRWPIRLQGKK